MKKNLLSKDIVKGYLFAFIAIFSWGIHGPAGRFLAVNNVDMYFVTVIRFWIGASVFAVFLLAKKQFSFSIKKDKKLILFTSLIGVLGNSVLYHLTLKYLSGSLVMILENLSPIFVVALMYFFYRKKPTIYEILALIISQIGLTVIILGKNKFIDLGDNFIIGIILGVLTGLTFGLYTFFSKRLILKTDNKPITIIRNLFVIFFISAVFSLPLLLTVNNFPVGTKNWFWIIEMGIFQSGISYLFWNYALLYLSANRVAILFLFTIVFTIINEVVFLDLKLNLPMIVGGLMIFLSGFIIKKQKNYE